MLLYINNLIYILGFEASFVADMDKMPIKLEPLEHVDEINKHALCMLQWLSYYIEIYISRCEILWKYSGISGFFTRNASFFFEAKVSEQIFLPIAHCLVFKLVPSSKTHTLIYVCIGLSQKKKYFQIRHSTVIFLVLAQMKTI